MPAPLQSDAGPLVRGALQPADQPSTPTSIPLRHAAVRQRRCSYPTAAAAATPPPSRLPARRASSATAAASPAAAAAAAAGPDELVITRPDDWHLHVRDGAGLRSVVPHTAATYGRAIIMPNLVRRDLGRSRMLRSLQGQLLLNRMRPPCSLATALQHQLAAGGAPVRSSRVPQCLPYPQVPPVTTAAAALEYKQRVLDAVPAERRGPGGFTPLMTCYLTDNTQPEDAHRAKEVRTVAAAAASAVVPAACCVPLCRSASVLQSAFPLFMVVCMPPRQVRAACCHSAGGRGCPHATPRGATPALCYSAADTLGLAGLLAVACRRAWLPSNCILRAPPPTATAA